MNRLDVAFWLLVILNVISAWHLWRARRHLRRAAELNAEGRLLLDELRIDIEAFQNARSRRQSDTRERYEPIESEEIP